MPLGSTNMTAALQAAADCFNVTPTRPRKAVYIGDGLSRANWHSSNEFPSLMDSLVQLRVAVSSFAIGPHRDAQLLAADANQTGGILFVAIRSVLPARFSSLAECPEGSLPSESAASARRSSHDSHRNNQRYEDGLGRDRI